MKRAVYLVLLAMLLLVGCNKKTAVERPTIIDEPPVVTEPQQRPRQPLPPLPKTQPKKPKPKPVPLPQPRPPEAPRMHEVCTWFLLPIFQHCEMVPDEQKVGSEIPR
jgi:hypothetical protein